MLNDICDQLSLINACGGTHDVDSLDRVKEFLNLSFELALNAVPLSSEQHVVQLASPGPKFRFKDEAVVYTPSFGVLLLAGSTRFDSIVSFPVK